VDIAHYDCWRFERYYFPDLGSAVDFYLEGWQKRQYFDSQGNSMGINHSGLYSRRRLVDGLSIHGAPPGHEGESLRAALSEFCKHLEKIENNQNKRKAKKRN